MKTKLTLLGYSFLIVGVVLYLYLVWNNKTAESLDRLPVQYSLLSSCDKVIEMLRLTDRVIPVGNETSIYTIVSLEYMKQEKCPKNFTVTLIAPDFDVSNSLTREFEVTSDTSWSGGAWTLKPRNIGIYQVFLKNGDLYYSAGIAVIPQFLGISLSHDSLEFVSFALCLIGFFIVIRCFIKTKKSIE